MSRRGFTLIELLVVISIIALLISILMPSLNRARDQAKGTVCLSNLKGIGYAALFYAEEYDDYIPRSGGVWILNFMPFLDQGNMKLQDFRAVDIYNCPMYPDPKQALDYVRWVR